MSDLEQAKQLFFKGLDYFDAGDMQNAELRFRDALQLAPRSVPVLSNLAVSLMRQNNFSEAQEFAAKAIGVDGNNVEALLVLASCYNHYGQFVQALDACDRIIAIEADVANVHNDRGVALQHLVRYDEALAAYDKAIALKPDLAGAWLGRGNVLRQLTRFDEAFAAYDKAFAIKPDLIAVEGARLHAKQRICDWSNFDVECKHLIESVRNGNANAPPFSFLAVPSSAEDQLQCTKLWVAEMAPPARKHIWQAERYIHDRIRLAYLSADFHQHATSYLMAGLLDCHDKSHFEVTAISFGVEDNSEYRKRLKSSFEHFIEAKTWSDEKIALYIKEGEIDIVIDLKGFTQDSRTNILARRCAPIQVSYLGYPGTMAAEYFDYIVADEVVIPENQRAYYSENIVFLPNSYQVNDVRRYISDRAYTRAELGLPLTGFVFCCFNNNYKITPRVFDCWMRILKQVENSVLWLVEDNETAANNLRKEAVARGINAGRLIFAKRMPLHDHLARHRLASLFLDTLPYNAHTTASDALWAGLPVLTCIGETFAGRVAASLLNAIGLPELITTTPEDYERMAIDLATHPEKLTAIKNKLAENRLTTPLFDTRLFTKHIEAAYMAMYERYQAGLPPEHISISN